MLKLNLFKLVLHFAQTNRAEGKSPKTAAWHGEMLRAFIRFLESTATRYPVIDSRVLLDCIVDN